MINKIVEYVKKSTNLFIFIFIFCCLTVLYNYNSQHLNYIFKRGIILEYSIPKVSKINQEEITEKLKALNIKYSLIDIADNSEFDIYDFENKKIEKSLFIALPILAKENKKEILNNISDFIFENYNNSELIDIKTLNYNYHEPYGGITSFIGILFGTSFIWLILMYIIYDVKTTNQKIKQNIENYFKKQKENLKKLITNTKEKGIGYFIRTMLLDSDKEEEKESSLTREIISTIIFVIVAVILIRHFVGELRWIPSGSMRPTILEHDRVFVEKVDALKQEVKRGDILVFYPPSTTLSNNPLAVFARLSGIFCKDIAYIKRVIGLPDDKFEIKFNETSGEYRVYINDKPLSEPYISSKIEWTPCTENMHCGPFIIPKNNYFMMGDNRNNSQDSRFWGFLDGNRIIGRANFMFWPVKRINILTDKYLELNKQKTVKGYETYKYIHEQ